MVTYFIHRSIQWYSIESRTLCTSMDFSFWKSITIDWMFQLETMIEHLFPSVSMREPINGFIDRCLLNNSEETDQTDQEANSNGFVLIQRFPKFNIKTIEQNSELMRMGLVNTLDRCKHPSKVEMTEFLQSFFLN